jgi:hypothetical protein
MAGTDQSARLQGLLSGIADSVGGLGAGGDWTSNAIRNIARPEIDTADSKSIMSYADWARRNGYDDEAKQYMALGASQQKVEQEKAYTTSVATGTEKLRGIRGNIAGVNQEIARQEAAGVVNPDLLDARDTLTNQLNTTVSNLNAMGSASNYGNGTEGAEAMRSIDAYVYEQEKQGLEIRAARNNALEDYQAQLDRGFQASVDPNMYMDPAQQAVYEAEFGRVRATLEQTMGEGSEEFKTALILFNERRAKAAKTQNEKYWTKVEAQAVKLGELGVERMLADLNRESVPTSSLGGKIVNFVADIFTDQADVVDWASNPDNQMLIQKAIERVASTAPYVYSNWDTMAPSDKLATMQDDIIKNLSQNPAFAEEYAEDIDGQSRDRKGAQTAAEIQDLSEGTMTEEYQAYLSNLDEQYRNAGMGGIDAIRENNAEEWAKIQSKWQEIWNEMEGTGLRLPATGPMGTVPSP